MTSFIDDPLPDVHTVHAVSIVWGLRDVVNVISLKLDQGNKLLWVKSSKSETFSSNFRVLSWCVYTCRYFSYQETVKLIREKLFLCNFEFYRIVTSFKDNLLRRKLWNFALFHNFCQKNYNKNIFWNILFEADYKNIICKLFDGQFCNHWLNLPFFGHNVPLIV